MLICRGEQACHVGEKMHALQAEVWLKWSVKDKGESNLELHAKHLCFRLWLNNSEYLGKVFLLKPSLSSHIFRCTHFVVPFLI